MDENEELLQMVKAILESGNQQVIGCLRANLLAYQRCMKVESELQKFGEQLKAIRERRPGPMDKLAEKRPTLQLVTKKAPTKKAG
jgi:hypothetical protein